MMAFLISTPVRFPGFEGTDSPGPVNARAGGVLILILLSIFLLLMRARDEAIRIKNRIKSRTLPLRRTEIRSPSRPRSLTRGFMSLKVFPRPAGLLVLVGLLVPVLVPAARSAEPLFEKVQLFEAGADGYALYRIPGIVVTKKGTVLACCEARKNDKGDWGPIDVVMRRSTDGGRTWGPRQQVVHLEGDLPVNPPAAAQNLDKPGDNTVNNPVAITDPSPARCIFSTASNTCVAFTCAVPTTA
jgi:hypothetical protein